MSILSIAGLVLMAICASELGAQQTSDPRFRSGLTATVIDAPPVDGHACRQVALRWQTRAGARSYRALTAPSKNGAWTALGAASACGAGRITSPTTASDPQPEPAAASPHRLFYRVVALGANGAIDSTDVVPVELTAIAPAGRRP
ncbi:MAG TPA: hypothetical protein VHB25_06230 [Gemmatimonadaceae bacterium]|nr:hypothetical protein [Gemmatimonadaceae bacterium]